MYLFDGFVQCSATSLESVEKVFVEAVKAVAKGGKCFSKNSAAS
ncbi:unnamed protein product, partial [Allacma fusca]